MKSRELYLTVTAFAERARSSSRTLEEYLRAVLVLSSRYKNLPYLGTSEFLDILSEALSIDSLPFDPLWADKYNLKVESANHFAVWEATVRRQVWISAKWQTPELLPMSFVTLACPLLVALIGSTSTLAPTWSAQQPGAMGAGSLVILPLANLFPVRSEFSKQTVLSSPRIQEI
jgi:hypothetical protein